MIQIKKCFIAFLITIFLAAVLSACGREAGAETEEKAFGIDYSENLKIRLPEQVVCGSKNAWVITTVKNDFIYQTDYNTGTAVAEEIEWQQEEGESLINIAERDGTLYAEIQNAEGNTLEIRRHGAGGKWSSVMTIKAEDAEWYIVGSGLFVDGSENAYLVSGNTVTRFGADGEQVCAYKLGGSVCFFLENGDGYVECVAAEIDGITLYELKENKAEEKWTYAVSAGQIHGIRSSEEETLCLATNEEILFFERASGGLLARSDLMMTGVSYVLAGNYDAEAETLRLYGLDGGSTGNLFCSQLSGRDTSAEQRTELVYGTVGHINGEAPASIKAAIMEFNQKNENYYITVKNYFGEDTMQRLHADMASGNAPDIINLEISSYYEYYVKNGYLEDLYPYLEQSEYKDDIIWNVLNTYEINGGLYLITPQFRLCGIAIHPEYETYVDEWNIETFLTMVEKNQWEKDIFGMALGNPETLLYYMLACRQEEFIDWERGEAAFETEEFADMLALCKEYSEADRQDTSEWNYWDYRRNTLCWTEEYAWFLQYLIQVKIYGREYQIYGYPTSSGEAYGIVACADCCAIYAGSEKKEGAWEFIESLLDESHQKWQSGVDFGFPIRSSVLKELEAEGITTEIDGEEVTMTEEEFFILEDIFYHGKLVGGLIEPNIRAVIEEETAAYFAGDKSAEEVAHIIQSRVEIILNE